MAIFTSQPQNPPSSNHSANPIPQNHLNHPTHHCLLSYPRTTLPIVYDLNCLLLVVNYSDYYCYCHYYYYLDYYLNYQVLDFDFDSDFDYFGYYFDDLGCNFDDFDQDCQDGRLVDFRLYLFGLDCCVRVGVGFGWDGEFGWVGDGWIW